MRRIHHDFTNFLHYYFFISDFFAGKVHLQARLWACNRWIANSPLGVRNRGHSLGGQHVCATHIAPHPQKGCLRSSQTAFAFYLFFKLEILSSVFAKSSSYLTFLAFSSSILLAGAFATNPSFESIFSTLLISFW